LTCLDHEKKTDTITLTLDNSKLDKFENPVWERGNIISVVYGQPDRLSVPRTYRITKIKGGRVLTVTAKDKSTELDTKPVRAVFDNVTRSDVVKSIATKHGYSHEFIEDTTEVFETITQHNISDTQMARKMARREGFQFFMDQTGFHWHERDMGQAPMRALIYHVDPNKGDILDWDVENDISRKPGKVTVKGRNPKTREPFTAEAGNLTDNNRNVLSDQVLILDEETGRAVLGVEDVVETEAPTQQAAAVEAKRLFRKAQQMAVRLKLVIRGDAQILAKSVVEVMNMGPKLSGKYYVQSSSDAISTSGGFKTTLHMVTDGHNSKKKAKQNSGASNSIIQDCISELQGALGGQVSTPSNASGATISQAQSLVEDLKALLQQPEQSRSAGAKTAKDRALRVARSADRSGVPNLGGVARNCAGVLQRLIVDNNESPDSGGKKNNKSVPPEGQLTPKGTIDEETGQTVISYDDSNKRGQ
jgi:phage protein D